MIDTSHKTIEELFFEQIKTLSTETSEISKEFYIPKLRLTR